MVSGLLAINSQQEIGTIRVSLVLCLRKYQSDSIDYQISIYPRSQINVSLHTILMMITSEIATFSTLSLSFRWLITDPLWN